jgi:hypothetical protein
MNNQARTLPNTLEEKINAEDNIINADPLEEEITEEKSNEEGLNEEELNDEEESNKNNIKSVELTGKESVSLNLNNQIKKTVPIVSANGNVNNLSKKKNNNFTRNLTQKQKQITNVNVATNKGADTDSNTKTNVMRSLNTVAMNLLNHQIVLKLFHFQTELYGAHKASDSYLEKFASTMDKFLEIAQGIYGRLTIKKFKLEGSSHNDENILKHIEGIINLLRKNIDDVLDNYTDLINIRDELVGNAEQLKYLLTCK